MFFERFNQTGGVSEAWDNYHWTWSVTRAKASSSAKAIDNCWLLRKAKEPFCILWGVKNRKNVQRCTLLSCTSIIATTLAWIRWFQTVDSNRNFRLLREHKNIREYSYKVLYGYSVMSDTQYGFLHEMHRSWNHLFFLLFTYHGYGRYLLSPDLLKLEFPAAIFFLWQITYRHKHIHFHGEPPRESPMRYHFQRQSPWLAAMVSHQCRRHHRKRVDIAPYSRCGVEVVVFLRGTYTAYRRWLTGWSRQR